MVQPRGFGPQKRVLPAPGNGLGAQPSLPGIASQADPGPLSDDADLAFLELRRKVRDGEVLSASLQRLLAAVRFTGRLSIVVQNGRVLKSGYEEGYFNRRQDKPLVR